MWDSYWRLYGYVGFERVLKGYRELYRTFYWSYSVCRVWCLEAQAFRRLRESIPNNGE